MKNLMLMDCTLRDGANVVGKGFSAELTTMMIEGLIRSHIKTIEMGNAYGLGAYEANGFIAPLTDVAYLELGQPYINKADIGMFKASKMPMKRTLHWQHSTALNFCASAQTRATALPQLKVFNLSSSTA